MYMKFKLSLKTTCCFQTIRYIVLVLPMIIISSDMSKLESEASEKYELDLWSYKKCVSCPGSPRGLLCRGFGSLFALR